MESAYPFKLRQTAYKLRLLAPATAIGNRWAGRVAVDEIRHKRYLTDVQRLRAQTYLSDGAISISDVTDGRFTMHGDEESWHCVLKHTGDRQPECLQLSTGNALPG